MKFISSSVALISLLLSTAVVAQNADPNIMTIDGKPVSKSEFETIYKKNNKDPKVTKEALDEYIELFVKFKLKVAEAERLGLDTTEAFKNELEGYRKQLAKPYLTDNILTEDLIKEAYERMQWEVKASHILFKIGGLNTPADTLAAYKKAMDIKRRIETGSDFGILAQSLSDDPSAKQNNGDLGYFTGLMMVYPFETAAFNTPVGKISDPVRSSFGYHLIKVIDRRPARGEVKVAHILIPAASADPVEKQKAAKEKIDEIYKLAKGGNDFAELAKKYSEDKTTAQAGGVLPLFGTGKMVESFENAAFSLKNTGDISEPVQTSYGWHLIKLIEKKPVGKLDELRPVLVKRISRDDRSKMTKNSFLKKIKTEYKFVEFKDNVKAIAKMIDSTYYKGTWTPPAANKLTKPVMQFAGLKYTQKDLVDYLDSWKGKTGNMDNGVLINNFYDRFVDLKLTDYEESRLAEKYPEFKALYKEYRDGILLFDLTNQMVWNKAVDDTTGLHAFYMDHQQDYMWKKRADAVIYKAKDKKVAEAAMKMVKKKKSKDDILKTLNSDSQLNLAADAMVAEMGTNPIIDAFIWKTGLSEIKTINGQEVFIQFNNILEPQTKKLDETRGAVTAAYQNYLEENWIKELKNRYKVQVNNDVLYSVQ